MSHIASEMILTRFKKITPALGPIVVVILAVFGLVAYAQQRSDIGTNANALAGVNKQLTDLKSQLDSLQKQYKSDVSGTATPTVAPASQADLIIAVNSAARFNMESVGVFVNKPRLGVAVNMTVTNPTTSYVSFAGHDVKLEDMQGNAYLTVTLEQAASGGNIPAGDVILADQTLAPGQSVRGALYYEVDDNTLLNFKLLNGTKSYSVTAQ